MRDSRTLLHRLYLWYLDQPESVAHWVKSGDVEHPDWHPITVRTFWLSVVKVAMGLRIQGIKQGDRVFVVSRNSPEWIQVELGVLLAGGVSVGVSPLLRRSEFEKQVSLRKPKVIFFETQELQKNLSVESDFILAQLSIPEMDERFGQSVSGDERILRNHGDVLLEQVDPDAEGLMILTSGTTGEPKGVLISLNALTYTSDAIVREWLLPFSDGVLFSFLPLHHIAEKLHSMGIAISQRYEVYFNSEFSRFSQELKEVRPTLFLAVPRVWEQIQDQLLKKIPTSVFRWMGKENLVSRFSSPVATGWIKKQMGLDRLVIAASGASKLSESVGLFFKRIGIEILEIYGMTETTGLITMTRPNRKNFKYLGQSPRGIDVDVMADGQVRVKGRNLFLGYDQLIDETHEVLSEGWLRTGDLGEWDPEHRELHLIGRSREILKLSNGRMVAPVPIENLLKTIPQVSNACVLGDGRPGLFILVTLKEEERMKYLFQPGKVQGVIIDDEDLQSQISQKISMFQAEGKIKDKVTGFVILSRDFSADQGEITGTFKIQRQNIQKNFARFLTLVQDEEFFL